jgi:signal transduction histidine kinase
MGKTELLVTIILFDIIFVLFIAAIFIYIRKYIKRKKEYLIEIAIKNEMHEKELLAAQLEIQQATMQEIGRELHDNIGQKLILVNLYSQQLLYENKFPECNAKIEQISQITNQSLQDLRNLSKTLTDESFTQVEIVDLIQKEVENINALKKCKVHFEHNFEYLDLNFKYKNAILRIIQEFIQNSIKHSQCTTIFIVLNTSKENLLELKINDDGIGFDTEKSSSAGIGLTNMKNRAAIINADFKLSSEKNKGTCIHLILKPMI